MGVIYGDIGTTSLSCNDISIVEKNEYVQINHEAYGTVLGRVDEIERKTDLSLDRAYELSEGNDVDVEEKVSAVISIIGYRDDRGLLQVPHIPFKAGEFVYKAEEKLIKNVLGLKDDEKKGAYVGMLLGHDLKIFVDINSMVQKHVSVLSKTGGGKSYITGVLIEEMMKHKVTSIIIDPHAEYHSLSVEGKAAQSKFGVVPRSYGNQILEYASDTRINPGVKPLKFTLSNLDARDILELTNLRNARANLTPLRRVLDALRSSRAEYNLRDIIRMLEKEEDTSNYSLINELEYLEEVDIFAREGTRMDQLVVKGKTTIINLKGTPPDIQELIINRLASAIFHLRKMNKIPPLMLVVEEAHNFCPQQGHAACTKIFRTIASEGRKFGLGLLVVTQRAAKIDKNVLSQCNTQVILKVTNPNDLKAIVGSVEGLTTGLAD
ncbi:MAG: ATP-binding protein, partial [Thermoplasmata archaeon]|nr:ATP-binding protein [Thermoplasmata archaeon]